jgi:archaetidylinositol phosphate synthase
MLTKLKKQVQHLLTSEANVAHKVGLTPNLVTVIGFALAFLAALAYAVASNEQPLWLLAAVFLLMVSGFCDTLDGILARMYNQASAIGGFLDSLLDRYADAFILGGIIVSGLCNIFAGLAALVSSLMVSYSGARAEAAGIQMESIGIAERPERIIILAVFSLVAIFWLPALNIGVILIAVLATVTVLQRGVHVHKVLKHKEENAPNMKIAIGA